MATYSLSGSGTQTLTSGTGALYVTISTLPDGAGHGDASPTDYYGIGAIRPGNATAYWEPFAVIGGPQWMPIPSGTTRIGYAFVSSAVVSVAEVAGSSPLAFPLASLPDVALASVADAQVLAYQASTSKWINATPTGGGGSGSGSDVLLLNYVPTTDLANSTSYASNTWAALGASSTFTTTAATNVEIVVGGSLQAQSSGALVAFRLLIDGTGTRTLGGNVQASGAFFNPLAGIGAYVATGLSVGSHTVQLQLRPNGSATNIWCRPSSQPDIEALYIRVWQRG